MVTKELATFVLLLLYKVLKNLEVQLGKQEVQLLVGVKEKQATLCLAFIIEREHLEVHKQTPDLVSRILSNTDAPKDFSSIYNP